MASTFWSIIQKCGGHAGGNDNDVDDDDGDDGDVAAPVSLDVRRSTHKKVSVFLDAMAAASAPSNGSTNGDHSPLLCLQCTNGVASVVAVHRAHDWLRGVKVDDPEALRAAVEASGSGNSGNSNGIGSVSSSGGMGMVLPMAGGGKGGGGGSNNRVSVVELYKLPKNYR